MDNIIGIKCECSTNNDIDGWYSRKDIEEECEYLGLNKNEWMSFLLDRLFIGYDGWNYCIEDAFANNDNISEMTIKLNADDGVVDSVHIVKVIE